MKASRILSGFLILLAIVIAVGAVVLCFFAMGRAPILLSNPAEAEARAASLMDSLCQGDFDGAGSVLEGNPDLGVSREPEDIVGKLLWEKFPQSISYEFRGHCYAVDSGLALDMTVTYLDYSSVIDSLGTRTGALLEQRVEQAEEPEEVYDKKTNNYRQDVVDQVLAEAAAQALKEDSSTVTEELTLRMVYENHQWWVLPDPALIHVLSCGTVG